ncbi:hypothetical protein M3Y97_00732300 [Aphelenchoides bicaudatus]|nr:hypothetical protein M3Y97_00732300 [Aphelenchoides bicaudatus]
MSNVDELRLKLSFIAGYAYILLTITGIILNAYVVTRLVQLALNDYQRFKRGCGLPLAAMSISDLCSLFSIIFVVIISGFLPPNFFSTAMHSAHCKITIFLIHTLTAFSTWIWLFISALRYIAVYHPFLNITTKAFGPRTIFAMIIVMFILNSWLPVVVVYFPITRTCEEQALSVGSDYNRMLHGLELLWSYVLPAILTIALDIKVILVRPPTFGYPRRRTLTGQRSKTPISNGSANSEESTNKLFSKQQRLDALTNRLCLDLFCNSLCIQKKSMPRISVMVSDDEEQTKKNSTEKPQVYRQLSKGKDEKAKIAAYAQHSWQSTCSRTGAIGSTRRGRQTVRQWLAITTIHLLLNAPDYVLRLVNVMRSTPRANSPTMDIVALVLRIFYFAQFCFNAAYLSAIVYRRNIRPEKRQTTPKTSNVNLQIHPEYSRPQTRVGIRDESRRQSRFGHAELLRRYSADPRSLREPNLRYHTHLQVNQPLRSAPILSSYSSVSFRSEDLDSIANLSSARSGSTDPHNENDITPISSADQTSGLITFASTNGTNTPILCSRLQSSQEEWTMPKKNQALSTMQEKLWKI